MFAKYSENLKKRKAQSRLYNTFIFIKLYLQTKLKKRKFGLTNNPCEVKEKGDALNVIH